MTAYKHVLSLGTFCKVAWHIRDAQLSRYTGPFDWIFSSPHMVQHCIADRFRDYLDADQFMPTEHPTVWHHRLFTDRFGADKVFNHHDLNNEETVKGLARSTARFMRVIESGEPILFVATAPTADFVQPIQQTLAGLAADNKLIVLGFDPPGQVSQERGFTLTNVSESTEFFQINAVSSYPEGLGFEDAADNDLVRAILLRHDFDLAEAPAS